MVGTRCPSVSRPWSHYCADLLLIYRNFLLTLKHGIRGGRLGLGRLGGAEVNWWVYRSSVTGCRFIQRMKPPSCFFLCPFSVDRRRSFVYFCLWILRFDHEDKCWADPPTPSYDYETRKKHGSEKVWLSSVESYLCSVTKVRSPQIAVSKTGEFIEGSIVLTTLKNSLV